MSPAARERAVVWKIEPSPDCKNAMFTPRSGCGNGVNGSVPLSTDGPDEVQPGMLLHVASPTVLTPAGSSKLGLVNATETANDCCTPKQTAPATRNARQNPRFIGAHLPDQIRQRTSGTSWLSRISHVPNTAHAIERT